MAKQKVISFEELKENFCLETTKQRFLDFEPAKNNLNNYLKTRKEVDLQQLVGSVLIQCKSYFEKNVCTNNIWNLDTFFSIGLLRITYAIYIMENNHLYRKDYMFAYLEEKNGIYDFEYSMFNATVTNQKKVKQLKDDMEVGRFMLQCCADLLNNLLQEQEVEK